MINRSKEVSDKAYQDLIELVKSSEAIFNKEYKFKSDVLMIRRKISTIRLNYRLISNFIYKCFSAFYNHSTFKLKKYIRVEETINKAETEMWIRIRSGGKDEDLIKTS